MLKEQLGKDLCHRTMHLDKSNVLLLAGSASFRNLASCVMDINSPLRYNNLAAAGI